MRVSLSIFIFILLSGGGILAQQTEYFLVTSRHHDDLERIMPLVKVVYHQGRSLVVKKKKNVPSYKLHLFSTLRKINYREFLNFIPRKEYLKRIIKSKELEAFLKSFSVREFETLVQEVTSFPSRKVGTEGNRETGLWLKKEFEKAGLGTQESCFFHEEKKICNIIGQKIGKVSPEDILLVQAHFDSTGRPYAGADDNASGVAGLVMLARRLGKVATGKTLIFLGTNGEETGLLGSKHYVRQMKEKNKLSQLKLVINMDMIAYNGKDRQVDLETNREFRQEALWLANLAYHYTELIPNIVTPAWGSDHVPFLDEGVPSILTIEHWPHKTPCYHLACDLPDHLHYDYGLEIIKLNMAAIYLKSEERN